MQELLSFAPQSRPHYRRGLKAVALLQSVFQPACRPFSLKLKYFVAFELANLG